MANVECRSRDCATSALIILHSTFYIFWLSNSPKPSTPHPQNISKSPIISPLLKDYPARSFRSFLYLCPFIYC